MKTISINEICNEENASSTVCVDSTYTITGYDGVTEVGLNFIELQNGSINEKIEIISDVMQVTMFLVVVWFTFTIFKLFYE